MPEQELEDQLTVRLARETDLDDVEEMVNDFVKGHPAEKHPRSRSVLCAAYFGDAPVARLVVATRNGRAIGMGQWTLIYDMFWGMYGANLEWLYVRPEYRGRGVVVAIVAEICAQVRQAGGEFLHGGGDDEVERLYERVAIGRPTHECHVSAEVFQSACGLGWFGSAGDCSPASEPRVESSGCACANIGLHDRTIRVSHTLPTQGMRHFAAQLAISLTDKRPQES